MMPRSHAAHTAGFFSAGWRDMPALPSDYLDREALNSAHDCHVRAVLKLGDYPRSLVNESGHTEWLGPDNKRWGRKPRRAA